MKTFTVLHLFCGLGGGAIGFARARRRHAGLEGQFRTLLGVDNDARACADFTRLTGAPAVCADLSKMTPRELEEACGGEAPDVIFTSPPCKGYSRLLSAKRAAEPKYIALNRLVFQGLWLALETFRKRPPKLIILENVPAIVQRGAELLRQLRDLLAGFGYVVHESAHDCGELGGLAQHRQRFMLVARHTKQVPTFLYHPAKQRVRSIGEVLSALPMPDDPAAGPLHRLPRIEWKTWVRLALIPAGKDWRALGTVRDGKAYNNVCRIVPWDAPSVAVTGGGTPTAGGPCVADPRVEAAYNNGALGVRAWDEPSGTVTGNGRPAAGTFSVADPRFNCTPQAHWNKFRVIRWGDSAGTVIGSDRIGSGAPAIADPRIGGKGSRPDLFGVLRWDEPAKTISGHASVSGSNCPAAIADPRLPADDDRPDPPPVIVALDGTWHRPLTPLELAAIQSLPTRLPDGAPLTLAGPSKGGHLERIGNAVPPDAAQAIAEEMLRTLLRAAAGIRSAFGLSDVWVDRERDLHASQMEKKEGATQ